ncbi:MAG: hypothetical protein WC766_05210 [Patescibacteria group bacterium]
MSRIRRLCRYGSNFKRCRRRSMILGGDYKPPQTIIFLDRSYISELLKDPERAMANSRLARQYYLSRGEV